MHNQFFKIRKSNNYCSLRLAYIYNTIPKYSYTLSPNYSPTYSLPNRGVESCGFEELLI